MRKKDWLLILGAAALFTVYAIYFTNWFTPKTLRIYHTTRPSGMAMRKQQTPDAPTMTFGLDEDVRLTGLRVIRIADLATNSRPIPLWFLVSSSNSVPIKMFHYGMNIRGMKPVVPGAHAQPLETNVPYRLLLTAGRLKGEHDFILK